MQRIVEPELMDGREQAEAYARADFDSSHRGIIESFDTRFPGVQLRGTILDLGCGPGDITFRFAARFPGCSLLGVDGSPVMIELANERRTRETGLADRVRFIEGFLPEPPIPPQRYAAIVSNSLLHHLHRPAVLWQTVCRYAAPGTKIFIADLFRPDSEEDARRLVNEAGAEEPEILRRDFYNSLLAAFEAGEVEAQVREAGLDALRVEKISDRHLAVFGEAS
jgi:SAM-dependent methyltransferase